MEEKNDDNKYKIFPYPNKIRIKLTAYRNIFGLFSIFSTLFTNISIAIIALLNGLTLFQGIILIIGFFIMMMSVQFYNAAFDISDVKIRHRIIKK